MRILNLLRAPVLVFLASLLAGCGKLVLLNPAGDLAAQKGQLIVIATVLMLLIVVPVIFLVLLFAWRYRAQGQRAQTDYAPEWDHSTRLELVIWAAPLMIIIALGALTWITTHKLDPYRPLDRISADIPLPDNVKPLEVEVVSLDWKWLFVLPEQGIATVNELAAPVNRPIHFKLTSSSTMNAFYVPDLAGMIYTMPGMQTELNAVINQAGEFHGLSSHYSGEGFSGMTFKFLGLSDDAFEQWVAQAKNGGQALTRQAYLDLVKPTSRHPVTRYASVDKDLYHRIMNLCVEDGQMCMDEMMRRDAQRNLAHRAGGQRGLDERQVAEQLALTLCTTDTPTFE